MIPRRRRTILCKDIVDFMIKVTVSENLEKAYFL